MLLASRARNSSDLLAKENEYARLEVFDVSDAVTRDGALLVSDDANGTIFRVTRK